MDLVLPFLLYGGFLVIACLLMFAAHGLSLLPRQRQRRHAIQQRPDKRALITRIGFAAIGCIVAQGLVWLFSQVNIITLLVTVSVSLAICFGWLYLIRNDAGN